MEPVAAVPQPTVIPGQDSLIITDDLLNMSLSSTPMNAAPTGQQSAGMDLLGDGLDSLVQLLIHSLRSYSPPLLHSLVSC